MNKQEINIYREIQRNTEMAMKALDAVTDKIYDDRLAATVADQELQYSRLHDRAGNDPVIVAGVFDPYPLYAVGGMQTVSYDPLYPFYRAHGFTGEKACPFISKKGGGSDFICGTDTSVRSKAFA